MKIVVFNEEDIKKDGRYDKIFDKWFLNTDWFKYAR